MNAPRFHLCQPGLLALWVAVCCSLTASGAINFEFDGAFSGTQPPSAAPWATVSLSKAGNNQVELSISLPDSLPYGAYVDKVYLNYDPSANASLLTLSGPGISSGAVTWGAGNNAYKADGDGFYDIILNLPNTSSSTYAIGPGATEAYQINGPTGGSITPNSFYPYYSQMGGGAGTYLMALHLAGYNGTSAWLFGTPTVPEPNASLAAALLLLPALVGEFRFRKIFIRKRG